MLMPGYACDPIASLVRSLSAMFRRQSGNLLKTHLLYLQYEAEDIISTKAWAGSGHGLLRANLRIGFANTDHGVTIDLAGLNDVTLSTEKDTVSIGTGTRWEKVYSVVEPHGLSVVGGRVGSVGTGGYITGGTQRTSHQNHSH